MIEVGAAEVEDDVVLEAIRFGHEEGIKPIIELVLELREKCGAPEANPGKLHVPSEEVMKAVKDQVYDRLVEARKIASKKDRNAAVGELRDEALHECFPLPQDAPYAEYKAAEDNRSQAKDAFRTLEKKITHMLVAEHGIRADGRGLKEIRPIEMEPGIFSRTHGSAFFQRGETQSLVTCALGTNKAEQIVDGLAIRQRQRRTRRLGLLMRKGRACVRACLLVCVCVRARACARVCVWIVSLALSIEARTRATRPARGGWRPGAKRTVSY